MEWALGFSEAGSPAIPKVLEEMPFGLAAAWVIFRVLGSVITVPLAEELAFRGYALRRLVSPDFDKIPLRFTWLSFLLSSILFGALHGRWLAGTVAGMFYAWAMYRRGKVGDAIPAHATTNALIAADVLILGNWGLWS
jgi:CAAX prenyl protease-like protein